MKLTERLASQLRSPTVHYALIVVLLLAVHGALMRRYPIIYGGDTILRLVSFPRILSGHQLPLLQLLIFCTMSWVHRPEAIFALMALISALSCSGLYALTWEITRDRRAALFAALLYATHPFILYYSRVPYQEPLLIAGIAWGFYFLFRSRTTRNRLLSSVFFGIACFTRYEGWVAALIAAIFDAWRSRGADGKIGHRRVAWSFLLYGWAPAVWIFWNADLSPPGTYVLDLGLEWGKFYRPYFVLKTAFWWTESAVALLALVGFACSWLDRNLRDDARLRAVPGFAGLLLITLVFSAHGIQPDPLRMVTEREAFVPITILVLYGGIGAGWLLGAFSGLRFPSRVLTPAIAVIVVLVGGGYSLNRGIHRIAAANADPELKTDYDVARFLTERQGGGLILAPPIPAEELDRYLESSEKWGGAAGRHRASQLLKQTETGSMDYQRVLVFSRMGKDRLFAGETLRDMDDEKVTGFLQANRIDYVVVFSDYVPTGERERSIVSGCVEGPPEREIRNGDKIARIYAVPACLPGRVSNWRRY